VQGKKGPKGVDGSQSKKKTAVNWTEFLYSVRRKLKREEGLGKKKVEGDVPRSPGVGPRKKKGGDLS